MACRIVPRSCLLRVSNQRRSASLLYSSANRSSRPWTRIPRSSIFANSLHSSAVQDITTPEQAAETSTRSWDEYKRHFYFSPASRSHDFQVGQLVTIHGFLGKRRDRSSKVTVVDLLADNGPRIQVRSEWELQGSPEHTAHVGLRAAPAWSAVSITARVSSMRQSEHAVAGSLTGPFPPGVDEIKLDFVSVQVLNPWPKDLIVSEGVQFPPAARHLQLRFSRHLRDRLRFREHVKSTAEACLQDEDLSEVETPMLFKSTPEGAREFLVPTRRPGLAYALPQSPQQYKQTLMASGLGGYFQFARCFRDEDLRADRQPEFTQLDLEKSFATGQDVMALVERLVKALYQNISATFVQRVSADEWHPVHRGRQNQSMSGSDKSSFRDYPSLPDVPFQRISYHDAMSLYGSDKPDLRIPGEIRRIEHLLPPDFVGKISSINQPAVDCWKITLPDQSPKECRDFVTKVMDSLPNGLSRNPDGEPVFLIHDSSKPLNGFSPLGFEAAAALTQGFQDGDVLVMQARENLPFSGGATALGTTRTVAYRQAVQDGLIPYNGDFEFLWVVGFPLFTPSNDTDPGQGGTAGFSSTHHPFTAPLTPQDFSLLTTDPLKCKADHYDLVLNGTELGGGSRRIHVAHIQEYVMRSILKMTDQGVGQFRHLLEALRAGCPPHAGFALGFDRLVAILSGTSSVRDVIAFPKTMKGEDLFAKSPSPLTPDQLQTYHLALRCQMPNDK